MKLFDYLSDSEEEALLQLTERTPSELDQETLEVDEAADEDPDEPDEEEEERDEAE